MYDNKPFDWSNRSELTPLVCQYARASREPENFKNECVRTIQMVKSQADELGRPLQLFLSGGLDSEVVAMAMLEAGLDLNPITFKFKNDLNAHEIHYVEKFAKRHGVSVQYVELDIEEWILGSEASNYIKIGECSRLEMIPHMKLLELSWNSGCLPVLGNGDVYISRDTNPEWRLTGRGSPFVWNYVEYEDILAWFRFSIKKEILGAISFFQHTPELTLSMLREPEILDCINDRIPYKMSTRSTKYEIYFKYWPELERRIKFNGGERITALLAKAQIANSIKERATFNKDWAIPVNDFIKMIEPHDSPTEKY